MYIVVAIVFLSILVLVHEAGHMWVARIFRIGVPVFSVGMGPPLWKKKKGETEYRISAFLFGGYVKLKGMDPHERHDEDSFYSKSPWARMAVVLSGPFANFLLGFLIYFLIFSIKGIETPGTTKIGKVEASDFMPGDSIVEVDGKVPYNFWEVERWIKKGSRVLVWRKGRVETLRVKNKGKIYPFLLPVVDEIAPSSPAEHAGIQSGDTVLFINGVRISSWYDLQEFVRKSPGETLEIVVKGKGRRVLTAVPDTQRIVEDGEIKVIGLLGITAQSHPVYLKVSLPLAFVLAGEKFVDIVKTIGIVLSNLGRKIPAEEIGGPISIVVMTRKGMMYGISGVFGLMAFISINLGFVNLLPVLPLDGAHFLFALFEVITRKRLPEKALRIIEQVGVILLLLLIIFVLRNDILRLLKGKF